MGPREAPPDLALGASVEPVERPLPPYQFGKFVRNFDVFGVVLWHDWIHRLQEVICQAKLNLKALPINDRRQ